MLLMSAPCLFLVILWTGSGDDNYGPTLAHPDGGLAGGLEAVYGDPSPVLWGVWDIVLMAKGGGIEGIILPEPFGMSPPLPMRLG